MPSSLAARPVKGRATVLDCEIDRVDLPAAVGRCEALIASPGFAQHLAINAAKVVAIQDDEQLKQISRNCALVTADGQSIVWASRLAGDPLPSRVTGIDLMTALLRRAEDAGYRVFLFGATEQVLQRVIERLLRTHPRLQLAGFRNGYYRERDASEIAAAIRVTQPDILLVGISSPRKEYFLASYGPTCGVPFAMGVGGSFDVLAGVTRRAPRLMQRLGLEWVVRLIQEPRRLLPRYAVTNVRFGLLLGRDLCGRYIRRREASSVRP